MTKWMDKQWHWTYNELIEKEKKAYHEFLADPSIYDKSLWQDKKYCNHRYLRADEPRLVICFKCGDQPNVSWFEKQEKKKTLLIKRSYN